MNTYKQKTKFPNILVRTQGTESEICLEIELHSLNDCRNHFMA